MSVRHLSGDCRAILPTLPAESVHCVVTSPPYFGLRDYGTGQWEGGDPACGHSRFLGGNGAASAKQVTSAGTQKYQYRDRCGDCGATRTDHQIGLEATPEAYVAELVGVFREVRRVLRRDGTCWINLGDSYAGGGGYAPNAPSNLAGSKQSTNRGSVLRDPVKGMKAKDLIGIPWMVAFALRADGWYLRSDVIWSKSNPMPESVTDRPTKAHEYLFLLSRSARYFYDADAIKEEAEYGRRSNFRGGGHYLNQGHAPDNSGKTGPTSTTSGSDPDAGRNRRSVWTVATAPFSEAHFATFPPALIEPCIKAGVPERCCARCGAPWVREVEKAIAFTSGSGKAGNIPEGKYAGTEQAESGTYDIRMGPSLKTTTLGFSPSCACEAGTVPGTVLDPFGGAGTTGLVADRLQRNAILIELSAAYADMASSRISDDRGPLLALMEGERK